ncbi:hypothetical protein DAPPUDRAFT_269107 [Daphnia pulex]|uniref:Uncharacterized protein n=1 Tax=Daphnia pulex TaxID=6669 RepID=E9HYU6_DAPPU|nr:hypothetical protein DAPPUDRAFT_269107 [Daphnia pulex]|eukprot:EFX63082.1 hypothetical protein DAPPUDRAFT_269107 [Daphnia pulex]
MKTLVVWLAVVCPILATAQRYDGYQVYEATAKTIPQMKALMDLAQPDSFDFWTRISLNEPTDIMAALNENYQRSRPDDDVEINDHPKPEA